MSEEQAPSNVIQFPVKKKEVADKSPKPAAPPKPASQKGAKYKGMAVLGLVAISLATVAVNRTAFSNNNIESLDASSFSDVSRTIASVEAINWQRDSAWERSLSEQLASAQGRDIASTGIGHEATPEEKLRWGTLEEKYTIVFKSDVHKIETIELQDATTSPSYILDRNKFLMDYGQLLQDDFESAALKSIEVSHDRTIESYTLFDKDKRPKGEARFELDIHKRLLSLKVEPAQI